MLAIALMELVVDEAAALEPDTDAVSGFHEDALPRVYGYFLHRCGGSVALAEDVKQETFLAAGRGEKEAL
jgi:DNA-directed RNA polymerase specialized sigma24 family protein